MKNFILFLISPFLAIPFAIKDLYHQKKYAILIIALFFGYLSYLYLPSLTNDKKHYFDLHNQFRSLNYLFFLKYLFLNSIDFIFYSIIFVFSKLDFSFQFTSSLITFITIYLILNFGYKFILSQSRNKKIIVLFMLTLIFSLSQPHLFSGMRYYFGLSFVFVAVYYGIFLNNSILLILFSLLGVFTHFGTTPLVIMTIILTYVGKLKLSKLLFLLSISFLFIPREYLFLNSLNLFTDDLLTQKLNSYLGYETFLEKSLKEGNFNNSLRIFVDNLWYWFGIIFIIFNFRSNKSKIFYVLMSYMALCNLFYKAPDILDRFGLFIEIILIMNIFQVMINKKSILFNIFLFYILINFLSDINVLKVNYRLAYLKSNVLFLPIVIIDDNLNPKDFLK